MPNSYAIQMRDVSKRYGTRQVLSNVSFEIPCGACVCVCGPNGSGKSTLLRTMAMLERPQSGTICIAGFDTKEQPAQARSCLGVLGHQSMLYANLTAQENLEFFGKLYGLNSAETHKRSTELLEQVGLTLRGADVVKTFSRGMTQRLSLARALMNNPQVLLLDEPYTGLDERSVSMLNELIANQRERRTIVMVSHDKSTVEQLATHVVTINPATCEAHIEEVRAGKLKTALEAK